MKECGATIELGDDYGDNNSTFHCQLRKQHSGKHKEKGDMYGQKYSLIWEGDARITNAQREEESFKKLVSAFTNTRNSSECSTTEDENILFKLKKLLHLCEKISGSVSPL